MGSLLRKAGFPLVFMVGVCAVALVFSLAGWRQTARSREFPTVALAEGERRTVVVELFTSEGCSSCPPADRLLNRLEAEQPVPGAEIIALGWHVDYWNHLGWADRFSSDAFTARQYDYAQAFGTSGVYTPQMVVDGVTEFVGSDTSLAQRSIERASQAPKAAVQVERVAGSNGSVRLRVRVEQLAEAQPKGNVDVILVVTENNLGSSIARGENAGRRIEHRAVVRRFEKLKTLDAGRAEFETEAKVSLEKDWKRENLRAVVFLQEQRGRRILGAASLSLK
jgi:hypothetical protein